VIVTNRSRVYGSLRAQRKIWKVICTLCKRWPLQLSHLCLKFSHLCEGIQPQLLAKMIKFIAYPGKRDNARDELERCSMYCLWAIVKRTSKSVDSATNLASRERLKVRFIWHRFPSRKNIHSNFPSGTTHTIRMLRKNDKCTDK
jgi:hypothetical protein